MGTREETVELTPDVTEMQVMFKSVGSTGTGEIILKVPDDTALEQAKAALTSDVRVSFQRSLRDLAMFSVDFSSTPHAQREAHLDQLVALVMI